MPSPSRLTVPLTGEDIALIVDARDGQEYWQLSDRTWRKIGAVIPPSDGALRWAERPVPTGDERETMAGIERCRALADRLRQQLPR